MSQLQPGEKLPDSKLPLTTTLDGVADVGPAASTARAVVTRASAPKRLARARALAC